MPSSNRGGCAFNRFSVQQVWFSLNRHEMIEKNKVYQEFCNILHFGNSVQLYSVRMLRLQKVSPPSSTCSDAASARFHLCPRQAGQLAAGPQQLGGPLGGNGGRLDGWNENSALQRGLLGGQLQLLRHPGQDLH